MANKTFNTRVKNKRDTAANWEAVATTFQPLDGELIIVDTAAGKTRFKVGRYDTAKGRLLYYNEIPFTDEYLYNDLNESQGKIYDKLKGIDDKSIIEMTLESVFDNTKFVNYRIGLWQFSKTGFYKLNIPKRGTTATQLFVYAQKTKEDGTTPEDPFSQDNLLRISALNGDRQVESVLAQVDYTDTDTLTVYKVQFLNAITFPGTLNVNAYNKTTQKWDFTSVTESSAKWANNATQVSNALTLTKGDTTTKFDGSTAQTVSIPAKTSELTNDSDFTTQNDLDNLTNTVVSYSAQENITDEQKTQARTNIGAISSSDLVQADWNQNDETAKDYIKNKSLAIKSNVDIADSWTANYSSFTSTWLKNNFTTANVAIEINGQLIENLEYAPQSYGGYTFGNLDTVGVLISNSGMSSTSNSVTVSSDKFPDGITSARVFNIEYSKLPEKAIPEILEWCKDFDYQGVLTNDRLSFLSDNLIYQTATYDDSSYINSWMYEQHPLGDTPIVGDGKYFTPLTSNISGQNMYRQFYILRNLDKGYDKPLYMRRNLNSDTLTEVKLYNNITKELLQKDEAPTIALCVPKSQDENLYVLNPIVPVATSITSSSTNRQYAGAKAVYDYVNDKIPNNSNIVNGKTTGSLVMINASDGDIMFAPGKNSFSGGEGTLASGSASHTEGYCTAAQGDYSHAEGNCSIASGEAAHAEGGSVAAGKNSHAEGTNCRASGEASHAEGKGTDANSGQHVQGKYNVEDRLGKYAHIVGNGTNIDTQSNAHTLDWSGNAWFAGDVYVGSTSGTNKDDGSKKLATEEYVDGKATTITVDTALSDTSTNPVQNKIVKAAIDDLQAKLNEQEPLIGTTDTLTVDQVKTAILAGRPVVVSYTDTTYGELKFTNFAYSTVQNVIVSNMIAYYANTGYLLAELVGVKTWDLKSTVIAEKSDLDAKIQAINNQLGGLTGAMHFIGKATVDITDGSTTDPQIANYTTKEKGDVILGKDDHKEFVWNGAIWEELGDEGSYALKTTTINGKALSDNITLTASDVGAASASAIETMQAAIDSKPSAADAVYTATAESTDGVAYTATVSGIDSLTVGASFIMIPNKASTSKAPTLNVNGLGAKPIRRRLSSLTTSLQQGYSTNWIALNKPFTVVYDGTAWVIEGLTKTDGADIYGAVAQATADAKGNNIADTYATIAMLKSLLPKVTTITLTSNWVGDASPYYQDIALSCVTETSIVDLQPTPEQLNSWQDDGIAFTTLSGNGTVRVYVAGGKPSSAISVQVRVQEVTVI